MKSIWHFGLCLLLLALGVSAFAAPAENSARPLLAPIFGDGMVLQRGKPNTFWGWAKPGQSVRVTIAAAVVDAVAGEDGRWSASIAVPPPGGPYRAAIDGPQRIELNNVLVGDVWLCSGQSNMEFALAASLGGDAEVKAANHPDLRFYLVPRTVEYAPAEQAAGKWTTCTPETAARFSAVAYYFARRLQAELHVPIGLVQSAVGGSPAESWISAEALAKAGEFGPQVAEIARLEKRGGPHHGSFLMHWLDEHDIGGQGEVWAKPEFDDGGWRRVKVPDGFAELGVPTRPSVVWFRREIELPDPLPANGARVQLGVVERMDTIYVNGHWTGASSWVENPRNYAIPAGALRPGKNTIALRVFKTKPDGGFLSPADALKIVLGDGTVVPLAGEWRAAVSVDVQPPLALPLDFDNYPTMPTVLYNGMIAPVAPLAIAGALWYQGEANTSRAQQYRTLLPALIGDWRERFGQGEFPFYIVGLPAFMARRSEPGTDGWAELREVQLDVARQVRNTAVAVTIDTGDANDIHPKEKRTVGERLARWALAEHFGRDVAASGPTLKWVERRPGALALHFDNVGDGLVVRGEKLGEFAVAGPDRIWRWAEAKIAGKDVVVLTSNAVTEPVAARYAWQGNPLATLANSDGLPAAPFRTDDWPLAR